MELWIRSQDKTKLTKITNLTLDSDKNGILQDDENVFELLGKYKTKERALEILDEIHQRLIDLQTLEIKANCYKTINRDIDCVYQMPKN